MRWPLGILALALFVTALAPYFAIPIYWSLGTFTSVHGTLGGITESVVIGQDAPQPDWLILEPGALRLTASRWVKQSRFKDAGSVEVLTHTSEADIKALYTERLRAAGFAVEDHGLGGLTPVAAKFLAIGPMLLARDSVRRLELSVLIREPSGFFGIGPRIVQIEWRELWPGQASTFASFR